MLLFFNNANWPIIIKYYYYFSYYLDYNNIQQKKSLLFLYQTKVRQNYTKWHSAMWCIKTYRLRFRILRWKRIFWPYSCLFFFSFRCFHSSAHFTTQQQQPLQPFSSLFFIYLMSIIFHCHQVHNCLKRNSIVIYTGVILVYFVFSNDAHISSTTYAKITQAQGLLI